MQVFCNIFLHPFSPYQSSHPPSHLLKPLPISDPPSASRPLRSSVHLHILPNSVVHTPYHIHSSHNHSRFIPPPISESHSSTSSNTLNTPWSTRSRVVMTMHPRAVPSPVPARLHVLQCRTTDSRFIRPRAWRMSQPRLRQFHDGDVLWMRMSMGIGIAAMMSICQCNAARRRRC